MEEAWDDVIDIRRTILLLLKNWLWIAGATLVAVAAAVIVSLLMSPTYKATAMVAATEPQYILRFDPRIESVDQLQVAYKGLPDLATSDQVMQEVLQRLDPVTVEIETPHQLRRMLEAKKGADPSIVALTVKCDSGEDAARIANAWADTLAEHINALYAGKNETQVGFFTAQVERAHRELEAAEEAYIAFQAKNRAGVLQARLDSLRRMQADYLTELRQITYVTADIGNLQTQLEGQSPGHLPPLADQVASLYLEIRALNASANAPIQLQVESPGNLTDMTAAEMLNHMKKLTAGLAGRAQAIQQEIKALEPQILELQAEIERIQTEKAQLERKRSIARDSYTALARKLQEARIAIQDAGSGVVKVASYAVPSDQPEGPHSLRNGALAGVCGLMIGVGCVLVLDWWRQGEDMDASQV